MPAESNVQNVTSSASHRTRTTMPQPSTTTTPAAASSSGTGTTDKPRRWVKRYRTQVSASSASVLSTITAFPLDSVKTRLQTYPYNGFVDCVNTTYKAEGMRGFFRGRSWPPLGSPSGGPVPSGIRDTDESLNRGADLELVSCIQVLLPPSPA